MIRVTVWNEFQHERTQEKVKEIYPDGIHTCIAKFLGQEEELSVRTAVLHSGHYSKIMRKLLGTSMTLRWRHGDRERLFCTCPTHPIAQGIPAWVDIPEEEMYGEFFDIPKPDDVVFTGWFAGGEVFRSGCTFTRGLGKIFYFQPGHEEYPIYHMPVIQKIIKNGVRWCVPVVRRPAPLDNAWVNPSTEEVYLSSHQK